MKDSTQNRNDAGGQNKGQEGWEDPAFGWENMQEGIFEKIVKEDPDFFKEKRRRRALIWFWFSAAILVGSGLIYQLHENEGNTNTKVTNGANSLETKTPVAKLAPTNPIEKEVKQLGLPPAQPTEIAESKIKSPIAQTPSNREKRGSNSKQSFEIAKRKFEIPSEKGIDNQAVAVQSIKVDASPIALIASNNSADMASLDMVGLRFFEVPIVAPSLPTKPAVVIDNKQGKAKQKGGWAISATGGSAISFSKYAGNNAAVALRNDHTSPWFGYRYGAELSYCLAKNSNLIFGLDRQVVFQNIDIATQRRTTEFQQNILLHETKYVVGGRVKQTYGDVNGNATEYNRLVHYNEIRSLKTRIGWGWQFGEGKWHFAPQAGLTIGYISKQEGFTVANDGAILGFSNSNSLFSKWQFGGFAGIKAERELSRTVTAVMCYQFQQQLNNASTEVGMKLRPGFSALTLGLNYRFGQPKRQITSESAKHPK